MKRLTIAALLILLLSADGGNALGTVRFTFDGPPLQPPGTSYTVTNYYESGALFRPLPGSYGFSRVGAATDPRVPDDGTAFLRAALTASLGFSFTNGSVFEMVSVDLAEYSTVLPDAVTAHFIGYRADGSTVTTDLVTDGIIDGTGPLADFQTFYFDRQQWSNLTRVEIPGWGWSLDNLVVKKGAPPPPVGRVVAWGGNSHGQTNTPPDLTNIIAIAAGARHALALKEDGTVVAWGDNSFGQTNVPAGLTNVIGVAAGGITGPQAFGAHSVALTAEGTVVTWGYPSTNVPTWLSNVVAVSSGRRHSLALTSDGDVAGCGFNAYGDCTGTSIGGLTNGWVVLNGMPLTNIVAVAAGGFHSLALRSDGTVTGWGLDDAGQAIGAPSMNYLPTNGLVRLAGQVLTNVVAIAAGARHSLALKEDGMVVAWGDNSFGQTNVPGGLSNVVAIAASGNDSMNYSLALTSDGSIVSWGDAPRVPTGLTNVLALGTGSDFSMALVGKWPLVLRTEALDPQWAGDAFQCSIQTQSGRVYSLQYKDSPAEPNWTSLPLVAGTSHSVTSRDTGAAGPRRFYRVVRW